MVAEIAMVLQASGSDDVQASRRRRSSHLQRLVEEVVVLLVVEVRVVEVPDWHQEVRVVEVLVQHQHQHARLRNLGAEVLVSGR